MDGWKTFSFPSWVPASWQVHKSLSVSGIFAPLSKWYDESKQRVDYPAMEQAPVVVTTLANGVKVTCFFLLKRSANEKRLLLRVNWKHIKK